MEHKPRTFLRPLTRKIRALLLGNHNDPVFFDRDRVGNIGQLGRYRQDDHGHFHEYAADLTILKGDNGRLKRKNDTNTDRATHHRHVLHDQRNTND